MADRKRPLVRHSAARAEVGECYCPRCAPELHAPAQADLPLAAPAPQESAPPAPAPPAPPAYREPERIVVGGYSIGTSEEALRAEYVRVQAALRAAEAQWLRAYGELHGALDAERCAASSIRSLQRDLKAVTKGLVRVEMDPVYRADGRRFSPVLVAALTEAHRCAVALVSAMAQGPDWREHVAEPRLGLTRAFEALDALGGDHG